MRAASTVEQERTRRQGSLELDVSEVVLVVGSSFMGDETFQLVVKGKAISLCEQRVCQIKANSRIECFRFVKHV